MTFLSMMVLCFALGWPALARAQGNPWNNPVVSPRVGTGGEVTFSVSAPSASRVELSGQFMDGTCPMRKGTDGVWSVTVKIGRPDIYPYSFRIDGVEVSDPSNPLAFPNERFKASLLEMPDTAALYAIKMFRGDRYAIAVIIPRSCRPTVRCWCIPLRAMTGRPVGVIPCFIS